MSKLIRRVALVLSIATLGVMIPGSSHAAEQPHWKENNNSWYYIDSVGKATTGWLQDGTNWYYMWSDGSMAKDTWIQSSNGKWYYLGSNGAMLYNTTIGNYTLGSDGAWVISNRGKLTGDDISGTHMLRSDLGQNQRDIDMSKSLSYRNIDLNDWYENMRIEYLASNLAQGKLYLSEAKNQCIGKIVSNKYMINDIKVFSQHFKNIDCIGKGSKEDIIKQCSVSL